MKTRTAFSIGLAFLLVAGLIATTLLLGASAAQKVNASQVTAATALAAADAACVPPPTGLVSWWPGEGNADDIVDGNDGTLLGGAAFATGMVGQAFSLDGVDDHVDVGGTGGLSFGGTKPFSIDAWVNPRITGSGGMVVSKFNGGVIGEYLLSVDEFGVVFFAREIFPFGLGSTAAIPFGELSHITATYDGTTMKIYINGLLDISEVRGAQATDTTTPVLIGANLRGGLPETFFDGLIDEVEIFNRALTADEVLAIFDAGNSGKCRLLVTGPTPGTAGVVNTLAVTGATPGETVSFAFGTAAGPTAIPGCPGQTVDIASPQVASTSVADGSGNASISQNVPAGAAGKTFRLVAVQLTGCLVSNLVVHTFP